MAFCVTLMVWQEPVAYFHELGHNLFLNHAGTQGDGGYSDLSDAMGECCNVRCFSTPHLHQLGWAEPVATLHAQNLPAGVWQHFSLPASITASKHFLQIRPDWNHNVTGFNIFVAFR